MEKAHQVTPEPEPELPLPGRRGAGRGTELACPLQGAGPGMCDLIPWSARQALALESVFRWGN